VIVRTRRDVVESGLQVVCPRGGFISTRYIVAADGLGFSMSHTLVPAGDWHRWHYVNHVEACLCVSGHATVKDNATGQHWDIFPGTLYAPDASDDHSLKAHNDTVLICVFNPPLAGDEIHDEAGHYKI